MSVNHELLASLAALANIRQLTESVHSSLGVDAFTFAETPILGYHIVTGVDTTSVYVVTDRIFALFENNKATETNYTLTIALPRLRRVAMFEDRNATRLIIEIDADKAVTDSTIDMQGRSQGVVIPAVYELWTRDAAERNSLQQFQKALAAALAI